jgi:predicted amidohydrolase
VSAATVNDIYYSGDSTVINPMGEILYQKAHEEDVFTVTLQKEEVETVREKMPFWRDADPFMIMQ